MLPTPDVWSASQVDAEQAITGDRLFRQSRGVEVDDVAPWSPEELIMATDARLPLLKDTLCAFKDGVKNIYKMIWPTPPGPNADGTTRPKTTADVARKLKAAPGAFMHCLTPPPEMEHRRLLRL